MAERLAARFTGETAGHWVDLLAEAGIAAHAAASIDEAVSYLESRDLVYFERGAGGKDVARPGIGRWLSETPPQVGASPGEIGSQVVEILAELGISGEAVTAAGGRRGRLPARSAAAPHPPDLTRPTGADPIACGRGNGTEARQMAGRYAGVLRHRR